ncbi:MAG: hypothetical protein OEX11_05870 [Nitrosomonas sp.]|nr:hypothetical protein [Nitrosomonas sp.]
MRKRLIINFVVLVTFVSLLTNAYAWAFQGEVFTHELDNHKHYELVDEHNVGFVVHLCLDAAGQYQPFYFTLTPKIPMLEGKEALVVFIPVTIPESILDLPYHPPRNLQLIS